MNEKALAFYYHLVEQLYALGPGDSKAKGWTAEAIASSPFYASVQTSPIIEQLQSEAVQQLWHSPRQSWALAQVAYSTAQKLDQKLILSECSLTLAIILNTLGRFAEAASLLHGAVELFLTQDQPEQASRCSSEIALAYIYQDQIEAARTALNRSKNLLADHSDPLQQAYCYRIEGLLYLMQNCYREAVDLFQQAGQVLADMDSSTNLALARYDLADALLYVDPHAALEQLDQARKIPFLSPSRIHTARCDHIQAFIYTKLNRYKESLPLYRQAWMVFTQEEMSFLAARCDLDRGIAYYRLNQYETALRLYNRARAIFAAQKINSRVAMCDLNIANVYYDMNRYNEALILYQRVAGLALAQKRSLRAARCYTNMGLCYSRLGRYDQALVLHKRAQQTFLAAGDAVSVATSQENLAGTYCNLGRYDQALAYYQSARQTFAQNELVAYVAYCDMQMADLYLTLNQPDEAKRCLTSARQLYAENGMVAYQAACDRRLAAVAHTMGQPELALTHLKQAWQPLLAANMLIEIALCDLIEGKLRLGAGEFQQAQSLFQQAKKVLIPGLSDQAWQAAEGLALCALAQGDSRSALDHYSSAVDLISQARHTLPTEKLSSDFFTGRQHIFYAAIELALTLGATEQALELVEVSKAQGFLTQYHLQKVLNKQQDDPYLAHLVEQGEDLRQQLDLLRMQLTARYRHDEIPHPPTRGDRKKSLDQLIELYQAYEEVVEQLRLAAPSTKTRSVPFSVTAFRQAAAAHLSGDWACLEYFIEDKLVIFYLDTRILEVYTRQLTTEDRWILHQCVSSEPERRELIYKGTIRGFSIPGNSGQTYRQHLSQLLIPPEVLEARAWDMLILVPHGILHGLPFHTLLESETPLLERGPMLYVPSLHVLQTLWTQEATEMSNPKPLVYGLETFGKRANPLPNAGTEIQAVVDTFDSTAQILYGSEAAVANLKQMSVSGELAEYDLIHFATHTVIEATTPLLSRILLADDDLTVVDILELEMSARLVTLSTCHSALGEVKSGDEMMTLARAFFYAGAQTVVASLWAVEDEAAAILMRQFYQRLQAGALIPQALRQAQQAMREAGYTPYQWAPFVVIGRP